MNLEGEEAIKFDRYLSEDQISLLREKLLAEKERILSKDIDQSHYHLDRNETVRSR